MLYTALFGLFCNIVMAKTLHGSGGGHDHGGGGGHGHGGSEKKESHGAHGGEKGEHGGEHGGGEHGDGGDGDHDEEEEEGMSINEYAAYIHVIGDLIQSIGVVIASIVILCKPDWDIADPISTLFFAFLVMCTTLGITKQCLVVLMEGAPKGMDVKALE